jgi:hypothetical protein
LQIWEGNKNFTLDVEAKEELYSGGKRAKGRNWDVELGIRKKRKNLKENSKDQKHLIKISKL